MLFLLGIAGAGLGLATLVVILAQQELNRRRHAHAESQFWGIVNSNDWDSTDEHER